MKHEGEIKWVRNEGYTEDEITALFFTLFPKKKQFGITAQRRKYGQLLLNWSLFYNCRHFDVGINNWLKGFGTLIILGAISYVPKYVISLKNN